MDHAARQASRKRSSSPTLMKRLLTYPHLAGNKPFEDSSLITQLKQEPKDEYFSSSGESIPSLFDDDEQKPSTSSATLDASSVRLPSLKFSDTIDCNTPGTSQQTDIKPNVRKRFKASITVCPDICAICRGPATGFHYEAPACNGCKTFFRRSLLSRKLFSCVAEGKCEIVYEEQKTNKRTCRRCRFEKCLREGMTPLGLILDMNIVQSQIYQYALKRRQELDGTKPLALLSAKRELNTALEECIEHLMRLEFAMEAFRFSAYNPMPKSVPRLEALLFSTNLLSLGSQSGKMPNWPLQTNAMEGDTLLERILNKIKVYAKQRERKHWLMFDILTAVEYVKTFNFLNKLDRDDKVTLARSTILILQNMQVSWFSYEIKSDHMRYPDGTNYVFREKGLEKLVDSGIVSLIVNKVTKTEYVLLKAIVLANPAVPGLSYKAQDILNNERMRFARALLHHCLCEKGTSVGAARFGTLIGLLQHYEHIAKKQKDFHVIFRMEVPPPYRVPLIEDVMD